jgi:LacI family transcriptional regulator
VRQPREELGRRAAELVLNESDRADHVHEQVVFNPEIVARASTRT